MGGVINLPTKTETNLIPREGETQENPPQTEQPGLLSRIWNRVKNIFTTTGATVTEQTPPEAKSRKWLIIPLGLLFLVALFLIFVKPGFYKKLKSKNPKNI